MPSSSLSKDDVINTLKHYDNKSSYFNTFKHGAKYFGFYLIVPIAALITLDFKTAPIDYDEDAITPIYNENTFWGRYSK